MSIDAVFFTQGGSDQGERLYRGLLGEMISDMFFHPNHIVPAVKLIAALVKLSHHPVSQTFVKFHAVPGQIGVLPGGIGDTGVEV